MKTVRFPPGDALITPSGKFIHVSFPDNHTTVLADKGLDYEEALGRGWMRIGGNFPYEGKPSDYIFFDGRPESFYRHNDMIQDIVGQWASPSAIIALSSSWEPTWEYETSPEEIFENNVGDLARNAQRRANILVGRRPSREVRVRGHRRRA